MKKELVRINGWFSLEASDVILKKLGEEKRGNENGLYRLTTYEDVVTGTKFYSFGYLTADAADRPGHRGEWSSNSTMINEIFGVKITECAVKEMNDNIFISMAHDISHLEEIIPEDFEVRTDKTVPTHYSAYPKPDKVEKYGDWGFRKVEI
ncbi:MAG: hypothetical protein ACXAAH_01580 [Promethearchaeota archaeon]